MYMYEKRNVPLLFSFLVGIAFIIVIIVYSWYEISSQEGMKVASRIPLHVYQTWSTKQLPPKMKQCVDLLASANPQFQFSLFDDDECADFIRNNFEEDVYQAYQTLVPGAFKADLWRYCVLYINGGIYLDIKYRCVPGHNLLALTDGEHFAKISNTPISFPEYTMHVWYVKKETKS